MPSFQFITWRRREGGRFQPHEEEIAAGTYSDDTQLMLAVARSRLVGDWWRSLTEHELPFWLLYERGGGGATKRAATSWSRGTAPWADKGAQRYFGAGGNGVAMRIAPHSLTMRSFDDVAGAVVADGIATHGHPRALVGALVQAYAVHRSLVQRDVLAYGELIEDVLSAEAWRRFISPADHAPDWEDAASQAVDGAYRDLWNEVVHETEELLEVAREGMSHGALAVDRPVLEKLGAFGKSSGAGHVCAVGALFLASRYASQPSGGVVAAAFAKGADTDTLAAMTGAILGAIHGTDWVATASRHLEDGAYVRRLARDLVSGHTIEQPPQDAPPTTRTFWRQFGEPKVGTRVELPGRRQGAVIAIVQHPTKRADLLPLTWVVELHDGQTLHFKRVKKIDPAPTKPVEEPSERAAHAENISGRRAPRIGVVLHVADMAGARRFYERVVGLRISGESPKRTVFEASLALEPLPNALRGSDGDRREQLALKTDDTKQSFDARSAITIYVTQEDFERIRSEIEDASLPLGDVEVRDGRPTFRCQDPEGNVLELRAVNGA